MKWSETTDMHVRWSFRLMLISSMWWTWFKLQQTFLTIIYSMPIYQLWFITHWIFDTHAHCFNF